MPRSVPIHRREDILLHQYRQIIDEYRFEVGLNNSRMRDALILNGALFAAAIGLLSLEGSPAVSILTGLIFIFATVASFAGARSISLGHRYYRRIVYKKTLLEERLGFRKQLPGTDHELANLSIQTTTGMSQTDEILRDPMGYINGPIRRSTVTWLLGRLLYLLSALSLIFGFFSFTNAVWIWGSPDYLRWMDRFLG